MHLSCFKWNWSLNFLSSCWAALKRDEDDDDDRYASFSLSGIEVFPPSIFVSLLRLSLSHIVACRLGNGKKSVTVCRMVACDTFSVSLSSIRAISLVGWAPMGVQLGKIWSVKILGKTRTREWEKCHWENLKIPVSLFRERKNKFFFIAPPSSTSEFELSRDLGAIT